MKYIDKLKKAIKESTGGLLSTSKDSKTKWKEDGRLKKAVQKQIAAVYGDHDGNSSAFGHTADLLIKLKKDGKVEEVKDGDFSCNDPEIDWSKAKVEEGEAVDGDETVELELPKEAVTVSYSFGPVSFSLPPLDDFEFNGQLHKDAGQVYVEGYKDHNPFDIREAALKAFKAAAEKEGYEVVYAEDAGIDVF